MTATDTVNPIAGDIELGPCDDRATMAVVRAVEDGDDYVKSVPEVILLHKPSFEVIITAYSVTFAQLLVSVMIFYDSITKQVVGYPSFENVLTFCISSLAVACAVNSSAVEFWTNNQCLEVLKKQKGEKFEVAKTLDPMMSFGYIAKAGLLGATVVSIAQQDSPVGIITNCTGLLLIEELDKGLFEVLKIPLVASHDIKEAMKIVKQNPQYSPRTILLSSWLVLVAATLIVSFMCAQ